MSRYPFMERVDEYMDTRRGILADTSWTGQYRRYRRMERDLIQLKEENRISTLSPARMTEGDVKEFIIYRKGKKTGYSDVSHDITALEQLLVYCGNVSVRQCLQNNPGLRAPPRPPRLDPLPPEVYPAILEAYRKCDHDDLAMVRAFSLVLMSIACGTRNKELRLADVSDLDTDRWLLTIRHVKGEATYGVVRTVPVPEDVRPAVLNYLYLRNECLSQLNRRSNALFCAFRGETDHLSSNSFRKIKSKVEEAIGFTFELRDCRRTFGQNYLDKGMRVESLSVLMGHNTTKTTETYYCRVPESQAIEEARRLW
ncbi:MAG: site-specific integrase [Thermoplasmata archaeon]|nr:site-specific integrase [Thermoplasmata archaeon]